VLSRVITILTLLTSLVTHVSAHGPSIVPERGACALDEAHVSTLADSDQDQSLLPDGPIANGGWAKTCEGKITISLPDKKAHADLRVEYYTIVRWTQHERTNPDGTVYRWSQPVWGWASVTVSKGSSVTIDVPSVKGQNEIRVFCNHRDFAFGTSSDHGNGETGAHMADAGGRKVHFTIKDLD